MSSEFSKSTIDTLARRAGLLCSNIECRTLTAGPAEQPNRAITIGEAAHIFGSKKGSARYREDMTDSTRAEITNGIWLCRNCHKIADSDPARYSAELLFKWREMHEAYVVEKIGTPNEQIQQAIQTSSVDKFDGDPPLAKQILRDRPHGWEHRLTAELLRQYLQKTMRGWKDLQRGLYVRRQTILDDDEFLSWFGAKLTEAPRIIQALAKLYSEELVTAWGELGTPGDALEIRHVCKLIQAAAEQLLEWE